MGTAHSYRRYDSRQPHQGSGSSKTLEMHDTHGNVLMHRQWELCIVWRPLLLLFIAWGIGWHNIDWSKKLLIREGASASSSCIVCKVASGSVEENATLRV